MSSAFEMQFPTDDTDEGLHTALVGHADKLITAHEAALKVKHGDHVFVGTACATPRSLVAALEALPKPAADVELLHFLIDHAAFMVHPDWQGCSLASAMQQTMKTYAMARGVRGFVAKMLSSYLHMIRLARNSSVNVSTTEGEDGTVYVTSRF